MLETRILTSAAGILTTGILLSQYSLAQPAAPTMNFEVASVKEAAIGPGGVRGGCRGNNSVYSAGQETEAPPLGYCVIRDARLSHLIGIAYGVTMASLKTGPEWIQRGDLRFDVQAKSDDPAQTSERQLLTMLQNLLAERFQLKFHYETTDAPGFAVTVAKNGAKLKVSRSEEASVSFAGPNGEAVKKPSPGRPISMTARKYTIRMLTDLLTLMGTAPVLDKTGLSGEYDFTLSWDENAGPALSTALREQLGLSIEGTKVPVSTLVVDSAQKPSPN